MTVAVSAPPKAHVESYEGRRQHPSYRLPRDQTTALRAIFTDATSGMRSSWTEQVDGWAGAGSARDRFALFDAEAWVDRNLSRDPKSLPSRMHRCRDTLLDLAEHDHMLSISVLKHVYGYPLPSYRYDLFSDEVAPLVEMCPSVRDLAVARERARRMGALDRFVHFWDDELQAGESLQAEAREIVERAAQGERTTRGSWGTMPTWEYVALWRGLLGNKARYIEHGALARKIQLEHVLGDAPLDTAAVLREGLDIHVERRDGETKAAYSERVATKRLARAGFISTATREGNALLTDASEAFHSAWSGDKRKPTTTSGALGGGEE